MKRSLDGWTIALGLGALGNIANGLWMLADPRGWFHGIPAAVPDFGWQQVVAGSTFSSMSSRTV